MAFLAPPTFRYLPIVGCQMEILLRPTRSFWYRPEQCRLHSESNEQWCKINVLEGMGSVHFAGNGVADRWLATTLMFLFMQII